MAIPVTEKQKQSPLYKYYELDIAPVPEELSKKIMSMTWEPEGGLPIQEMNRLFDDGYLPGEFGMYALPDGGTMIANLTDMPGVTPEMFDWWFAWHGLDSFRYTIWDKDDHYYCQSLNVEQNLDTSLSMKERYWNTTHDVKESLLDGEEPRPVHLTFVPPTVVGFDPEKLKDFKGTIVCTPPPAIMIHFIRPTERGCELRTRFWMGYVPTPDGGWTRIPDFPTFEMMGRALLHHNVKEFTHLAKILPSLYAEFKDDFKVGLD